MGMKLRGAAKEFAIITLGTAIISAAVYFFMQSSHLVLGSVSGLAIVLENLVQLRMSVIAMPLSVGLQFLGFLLGGKEFGGKTVYTSILLPALLGMWEIVAPNPESLTQDPFVDMICYLFVVSLGQAMLFGQNASSGGLDVVGKIMNKFLRMGIGKAIAMAGMCIVLNHFIFGNNIKRRVCIISDKQDEILEYILKQPHSGATIYEAKGAYSNQIKTEVIVIVDKNEYRLLMNCIMKTDPKAFITIYNVNEVIYQPKVLGK